MTTPTLSLTPRRAAVLAGFDSTVDVLVRIGAPDRAPDRSLARTPLHLALVIDRSGSMGGAPLNEAKQAAAFVIDGLSAGDRASLVTYDAQVETRVPLIDATDRETFRRAIAAIQPGGTTNLHGGWFAGAETLAPAVSPATVSRVILLSDGCANSGLVDPAAIQRQCAELATAGVTTSTYGLGRNFNEDLMIAMARSGQGNNYYGQSAQDLMDPFREEFALLNALCARRVELRLMVGPGVRAQVLNDYPTTVDGAVQLPDLAYGGEAWALVRLTVAARPQGAEPAVLLSAALRYSDMDSAPQALAPVTLSLPAVPAAAYGAVAEDALVTRRSVELEAAQLQLQARQAALRNDWGLVDELLLRAKALSAENTWLLGVVEELQRLAARRDEMLFAKEAVYSSHRMATRLASPEEGDAPSSEGPAYLRRKTAQGRRDPEPPTGS